jgi:hypothetical protein
VLLVGIHSGFGEFLALFLHDLFRGLFFRDPLLGGVSVDVF